MYKIQGTTITLTRGDSFYCHLDLKRNGQAYTPDDGDVIRFALKKDYFDTNALISQTIPNDTLILCLLPADTKRELPPAVLLMTARWFSILWILICHRSNLTKTCPVWQIQLI